MLYSTSVYIVFLYSVTCVLYEQLWWHSATNWAEWELHYTTIIISLPSERLISKQGTKQMCTCIVFTVGVLTTPPRKMETNQN